MAKKTTVDIEYLDTKPGMVLIWDGKKMLWKSVFSLNSIEYKRYQRKEKLQKLNNATTT